MNGNLFDIFVDRNIVTEDTEIEARQRKHDLSGMSYLKFTDTFYYVAHFVNEDGTGSVVAQNARDGQPATILIEDIVSLDGMEPRRLASIYALNDKGESVRQGARRGRKPKNREAA